MSGKCQGNVRELCFCPNVREMSGNFILDCKNIRKFAIRGRRDVDKWRDVKYSSHVNACCLYVSSQYHPIPSLLLVYQWQLLDFYQIEYNPGLAVFHLYMSLLVPVQLHEYLQGKLYLQLYEHIITGARISCIHILGSILHQCKHNIYVYSLYLHHGFGNEDSDETNQQ